jgi:valyl-tRNA synthetase
MRHQLPQVVVIGKDARMTENAGRYAGLDRYACREQVVLDLDKLELLQKKEDHHHAVGQCYRCDSVVEPLVSKQWFVKMQPLAEPAMAAVKDGRTRFVPERFTKTYLNWLENIRDWCISRQLWWGHRIPVWYCQDCDEIICQRDTPANCVNCGGENLQQDPDVLDTWFSSGLWPFSTLGWPKQTPELAIFYPTSVLVTGRDIIFFWVARMIFSGLAFMHDVPFKDVLIHGLILDAQGRKMSKSLGNGVDPLEVIEEYGADTLRFMLVTGTTPGNDVRFHMEKLDQTRNFANKVWNASRFVLLNLQDFVPKAANAEGALNIAELPLADRWILSRCNRTIIEVTRLMENYDIGEAAREVYEFIWNEYCDWYIELVKPRLYGRESELSRQQAQQVLYQVLVNTLKLLHPFMPFITEEIYQHLPGRDESIMISAWPLPQESHISDTAEKEMSLLMDVIRAIRNLRAEIKLPPGNPAELILVIEDAKTMRVIEQGLSYIQNLAAISKVDCCPAMAKRPKQALTAVVAGVEIYLPLSGLVDLQKEAARLEKEVAVLEQEIKRLEGKLNNQGFLAKAPAAVVDKEKEKLADYQAKKETLEERLALLRDTES